MQTVSEKPDYELAAEELAAECERLGLTATWVFVPWSLSRNKAEKHRTFNWRFTLSGPRGVIMEGDYSSGIAHSPNYKQTFSQRNIDRVRRDEAINSECETGKLHKPMAGWDMWYKTEKPIPTPTLANLVFSVASDSDVLDYGGFEDWASNYGYDTDSRHAEKIYRLCVDHALALKAALGAETLDRLRELAGRM